MALNWESIFSGLNAGGSLAGLGLDIAGFVQAKKQDERNFEYNKAIDERNFDYTKSIDERNFAYEQALQQQIFNREDNAYQRAVADAQSAGLSKGVVSGGAGAGSVLGTASSCYSGGQQSYNMDWSKLGSIASNYQQRLINSLSMKKMFQDYDMSEYQKRILSSQSQMSQNATDSEWIKLITNPFWDNNGSPAIRDKAEKYSTASFEALMAEQEAIKKRYEYYSAHPWLNDALDVGKSVLNFVK